MTPQQPISLPRTPSFRLDGRAAIVTGASSGIGQAAAVALAEAGAHVVCAARRLDPLNRMVQALQAKGLSAEALALDQTDLSALQNALQRRRFDVVVNSAGLARHTAATETTPEDFDAVMGVNLRSAYFLSTLAAKEMIAAGQPGSIIHIGSQMGHVGGIDRALYCATKHGLEGMVKAMAVEWGPRRIRINTLCPTFINTPMGAQTLQNPERRAWIESKIKLGRVGEVEDIMGGIVYLASDASALITGTALMIDGGWTAE
ncbi:SDR family NAD(P)-dependent oxidoreductase [Paracoccus jeotgali]|uniref:3-oxoacyl-ACP reductase n=1 Tax=Paracoccus jeotgali TaxID=2065379 RepID=A0A2K9MIZ1_9RHOB|nr:SDR family oxidoreductase [Paracoccus jeotgali]AUM75006.1 3-oxoacyl-ACP reductase [Paracoccus jeotgali]